MLSLPDLCTPFDEDVEQRNGELFNAPWSKKTLFSQWSTYPTDGLSFSVNAKVVLKIDVVIRMWCSLHLRKEELPTSLVYPTRQNKVPKGASSQIAIFINYQRDQ